MLIYHNTRYMNNAKPKRLGNFRYVFLAVERA
jgi:hypothetical protein